jgi:hypothetical protein
MATMDFLNDKATGCTYTVFRGGEKDNRVDPREAIAQLCDPESLNPIFLTGLRLPMCRLRGILNHLPSYPVDLTSSEVRCSCVCLAFSRINP